VYISRVFQSALPAWFDLRVGGVVVLVVYAVYFPRSIMCLFMFVFADVLCIVCLGLLQKTTPDDDPMRSKHVA
jgi:hypothetical protein